MSFEGLQLVKWTNSQFVDLYDQGVLDQGKFYELVDGQIYFKKPRAVLHGFTLAQLGSLFCNLVKRPYMAGCSGSVELSTYDMPMVDLLVWRNRKGLMGERVLKAKDVVLALELSEDTLTTDRGIKRTLYAEGGIPEYWIVNLENRTIEVYRQPKEGEYTETLTVQLGGKISPLFAPTAIVPVSDVFSKCRDL